MRLPFSYRTRLFGPLLFTSFLGHALLLGAGSFLSFSSPQFSVQEAPSSLEVLLIKELLKERPEKTPELIETQKLRLKSHPRKDSIAAAELKGSLTRFDPLAFKNPAPAYPALARDEGWQGLVVLKVLVGADGRPHRIQHYRSSGHPILDESAIKAIRQWRFGPAHAGSLAFSSWIEIPIRFVLMDEKQRGGN